MFREYQRQESLSTVRTVSGASQSSEACLNGPPAEESAPSTVIELTVDELSQKSPESASSSTITSSQQDAAEERGLSSITVSNILAGAEEEEQKLIEGSSKDASGHGKEAGATVTSNNDGDEQTEETVKNDDNLQKSERNAVEIIKDSATASSKDGAQTQADEKCESEHNKGEPSTLMTENSLNEADTEPPVASDREDNADQMSPETAAFLDNSVVGGASVLNEDLVDVSSVSEQIHPSDADSQEESSYASAAAGEEGQDKQKEDAKHEPEQKQPGSQSETQEQNVTEAPEEVQDHQSSPITETATAAQEGAAGSDSSSPHQPSETSGTAAGEASAPDSSATASRSDIQTGADTVSKTKEIKIARLDVSNVALDTEKLELKVTSIAHNLFISSPLFNL